MKYTRFTILTTTEAEDFISAMLMDLGVNGVEIENNVPLSEEELGAMFVDFPPELGEDKGESRISFYASDAVDKKEFLQKISDGIEEQRQFVNVGSGEILISETEDKDWINNWKEFFHAFSVEQLFIRPTWEKEQQPSLGQTLIEIDPGISFGTGKHETTQLCLKQLQHYLLPDQAVLDIGSGSGILSIAAKKLGAGRVIGVDIDEACAGSAQQNWAVNRLPEAEADFRTGNLLDRDALYDALCNEKFDLVLSNILADVIIPLAPLYRDLMKPGAKLITSGIIDFKEDEVVQALSDAGLNIVEINHQGEWVNITAD